MPLARGRRYPDMFEAGGEIHPIRNSPGYSPGVEELQKEHRERQAQAERYRGIRREHETVERPPWAKGFTQERIMQIARDVGRNPYKREWWAAAGGRPLLQPGSPEYRHVVLEGGGQRRRAREAPPERGMRRGRRRERYKEPEALPF